MDKTRNDIELINSFRKGEEQAVKALYALHYRPLCYFAQTLVEERTEAEDIAIETFLKLLTKRKDFDNLPDIRAFLFTAARNACFDFLRKSKRNEKYGRELEYLSEPDQLLANNELITAQVLQAIYAEIENLPLQCKKIFTGIYIEGKSTAQLAFEMELSTQTILNQKAKAVKMLRLALYKDGLYLAALFITCLRHLPQSYMA